MNIYIGNLNYRVRESDLQQILEEYGVVDSVKIIVDRDTKRSKGFAFAEMPNAAEAQKAIEELNQAEYEGRQMVVKEAIPRKAGKRGENFRFPAFFFQCILFMFARNFKSDEEYRC